MQMSTKFPVQGAMLLKKFGYDDNNDRIAVWVACFGCSQKALECCLGSVGGSLGLKIIFA